MDHRHLIKFGLVISLLVLSNSSEKNMTAIEKLKKNWTKFIGDTLTPTMTCYRSAADYGSITVDKTSAKCDLTVHDGERDLCIRLDTSTSVCHATINRRQITVTLLSADTFCENARVALHMLVHSTSPFARHSHSLAQTGSVPRHLFTDPAVQMGLLQHLQLSSVPAAQQQELTVEASDALPRTLDYAGRPDGGHLLMDEIFSPSNHAHRMLVSAGDPRYQADAFVQWLSANDSKVQLPLTSSDAVYISATTCRKHRAKCKKACPGYFDAKCHCHKVMFSPLLCTDSSAVAVHCDPAGGSLAGCPYGTVISADMDPKHKAASCSHVTSVVNGLGGAHANIEKFLSSSRYPWPYFMVTILGCPGDGRLTDITVGFPARERTKALKASSSIDRDALCDAIRIYIANAEAQVTSSHNFRSYDVFCLDDLLMNSKIHLARPRRPAPQDGGARDAVHIVLGSTRKHPHVDFKQLVIKMYTVRASSKVLTPYKSAGELHTEPEHSGPCVVEINGENVTGTPPTDVGDTTEYTLNASAGTTAGLTATVASTGSVLGLLFLLVLFAYFLCQRGSAEDWESDSTWSQSPGSWTTSSTSSYTDTPISSDEYYSSDSFEFERDAHLVRNQSTLRYMMEVQQEALRKRRPGGKD